MLGRLLIPSRSIESNMVIRQSVTIKKSFSIIACEDVYYFIRQGQLSGRAKSDRFTPVIEIAKLSA